MYSFSSGSNIFSVFTFHTLKPALLIDVATYSYLILPHLTFPSLISSSEVTALILKQLHNKRLLFLIGPF